MKDIENIVKITELVQTRSSESYNVICPLDTKKAQGNFIHIPWIRFAQIVWLVLILVIVGLFSSELYFIACNGILFFTKLART